MGKGRKVVGNRLVQRKEGLHTSQRGSRSAATAICEHVIRTYGVVLLTVGLPHGEAAAQSRWLKHPIRKWGKLMK
jgi:hypothetical protein